MSDTGPGVETHKLHLEPRSFSGPAVLEVASGEVLARGDGGDPLRAVVGDVIFVGVERSCVLRARPRAAELVVFRIPTDWARPLAALAGLDLARGPVATAVERRGTDEARRASRLLRELALGLQSRPGVARFRSVAATSELLGMIVQVRPVCVLLAPPRRAPGRRRRLLVKAAQALEEAPLDRVSLAGLAQAVGLSERQVSRLFRDEFGRSFREHLGALKLERAKRLLRETEQSVLEIAGEAGFSSLSHFNAVFRRRVGATPSVFRTRARSRHAEAESG